MSETDMNESYYSYGMTLRDYFAAKALQGLLSNQRVPHEGDSISKDVVARMTYEIADAMLKEREK